MLAPASLLPWTMVKALTVQRHLLSESISQIKNTVSFAFTFEKFLANEKTASLAKGCICQRSCE